MNEEHIAAIKEIKSDLEIVLRRFYETVSAIDDIAEDVKKAIKTAIAAEEELLQGDASSLKNTLESFEAIAKETRQWCVLFGKEGKSDED